MPSTPSGGVPTHTTPAQASDGASPPDLPAPTRAPALSEDWLATIAGLVILGLVLAGVITKGMIP